MQTNLSNLSDNNVLNIQEVFNLIQSYKYEEAFLLSSQIMKRGEDGDQLFHEWVKALAEFYSCKKKETAIKLLEKIKPAKLENEIHFRIVNSLMVFYVENEDKHNFIKNKEELVLNLHILSNIDLIVRILGNIGNGYYEFKDYVKSLDYCEKTIEVAQKNRFLDFKFYEILMIKIMNLLYLGEREKADELRKDFELLIKISGDINIKEYLDKAIDNYHKEVKNNEKDDKQSM
ncbi:hypothetical protein PV797_07995 [Clostridiaceae bacterium M8S5]|nr:hypothetical protein PV797_07995 [Clostridiaceae bacterium M8S5]